MQDRPGAIDRLFLWTRSQPFFLRFAIFTRLLLAAGFIPTGLVKLLGHRFTQISPEDPIGAFFEALFQTGLYWRFLGATQVLAGLLLLWPRFAHLGAAIFFGVILNIFVVTVSLGFRGTPIVTGLMLLAVVYLCFYDYHRFRSMFTTRPLGAPVPVQRLDRWEIAGFACFGASLVLFFFVVRGSLPTTLTIPSVIAGFGAGLFTLGRFVWVTLRGPRAPARVA